MPATPWSSSLVSDRLNHRSLAQKQPQKKGKANNRDATPEPLKSQLVRSLEARLSGAREFSGHPQKDPKAGCFCQSRTHVVSPDVPICRSCGLILCKLNPAHCACPHCSKLLLDSHVRAALVEKLEAELAAQLAKEEEERQMAIEEARTAEGAFPMLQGSRQQMQTASRPGTPQPSIRTTQAATRTVLSLNSATGKVKVSSFSTPTVTMSRSASRGEDREEEGRVPGPPGEVCYVKEPLDPARPWRNVRVGDVKYVPLPGEKTGETSKRRQKKKGTEQGTTGSGQGHG